jgi:hypothetical protein
MGLYCSCSVGVYDFPFRVISLSYETTLHTTMNTITSGMRSAASRLFGADQDTEDKDTRITELDPLKPGGKYNRARAVQLGPDATLMLFDVSYLHLQYLSTTLVRHTFTDRARTRTSRLLPGTGRTNHSIVTDIGTMSTPKSNLLKTYRSLPEAGLIGSMTSAVAVSKIGRNSLLR